VWVGAELGTAVERNAATALLESLTWLAFTREDARLAGELSAELRRSGDAIGFTDCMIAAFAIENVETLVTRDADFERIPGLEIRSN
jgi:predicted nucleic acid-binding protein